LGGGELQDGENTNTAKGSFFRGTGPLPLWAKLILTLIVGYVGFNLCRRGLVLSDEGYLLLQAEEIAKGKVLYRDLDAFVAPGAWLALGALFSLVDPSVILSRGPALGCFILTAWVLFNITRRLADDRYGTVAVAVYLILSVWAFPAWSIAFYSPWATCAALLAFMRLITWRETDNTRLLFECGIWLGLALAFKQNYGAYAAIGCGLGYLALDWETLPRQLPYRIRRAVRIFPIVVTGVAVALLPILAYFVYHGAVGDMLVALFVYPFERFLGNHSVPYIPLETFWDSDVLRGRTRWIYSPMAMSGMVHMFTEPSELRRAEQLLSLVYWFPPLLIVSGFLLSLRDLFSKGKLDGPLLAITLCSSCYFLGVFPRADFNHLINVYPPIIVLGAVVTHRIFGLFQGFKFLVFPSAALIALVFSAYGHLSLQWYQGLVKNLNTEVGADRGGVFVDVLSAGMFNYEVDTIRELTEEGEPVLTLPGLSMINFLADRPMPSRYYNLYAVHIAHDRGAEVVSASEAAEVRFAITEANDFFTDDEGLRDYAPNLVWYLRRNFKTERLIGGGKHVFWERREVPLPDARIIDALSRCTKVSNPFGNTTVQNNLISRSLRHRFRGTKMDPNSPDLRELKSLCPIRVPKEASLSVEISYKAPMRVSDGTVVHAEIWAISPTKEFHELEPLLQIELPIDAQDDWASPAGEQHHINLAKFAGQNVDLEFRTKLLGHVAGNELDMEGFTVVWRDPHVEFPR
jgi:hypothetical protein